MATDKSIAEISCRFGKDRLEIVEYINFMRDQCAIHVQEVTELNSMLERIGLPELPTRDFLGTDHHLAPGEINHLVAAIDRITPAIDRVTSELNHGMDGIPILQQDSLVDNTDLLGDWTDYALHHLPDDPRREEYGTGERIMLENTADSPEIQDDLSLSERRLLFTEALRRARHIKFRNMGNTLQYVLNRFHAIKAIAKLARHPAYSGSGGLASSIPFSARIISAHL